jgi:type II restriction/modification system DNA methylase subunit YeeA
MLTKEEARSKIAKLVERFEDQKEFYRKAEYNETQTRRDFIDPFFKALGWDIDNEEGYAESYREVIHEDKVKVGKATKAPDYSFKLSGGKRLFFVEAKKPSVAVKDDIVPAYQVRRYGWNAKLAISVITNFEEFAIYDCTKKPFPTDKASVARTAYLTYKDYLPEFDFIWNTFSKESVLKGSFDKYIQSAANKKGTATVDKDFLLSLDNWRTYLATSISWNNKELDEDEINFAVQQTIDRIIFLRIAEGRGVEPYENLKSAIKQGNYYNNLFSIFKVADDKYNSGLFDFEKDQISKNLKIDNKVIKTIITELYYPESPYEFSVLAVEILGSAYEQFLGKVIRITPAHHAKIEEKPEVRKAGGVYYTPEYIVEYIVKNTVGKLVEGKTPKEISKLKIVDPACGSGSFLIGAYQYLLTFHKDYYSNNGKPSKGKKDNPLTPDGNLTTAEKKRILLNNIYGVDIDVNAVEVTKLSLLLKCMEGETSASIAYQLSMFNERVLPSLDENIKCGNSLVDEDFYGLQLDFGEEKKIKPFNWQKAFPEVFNRKTEKKEDDLKSIATRAKEHAKKAMEYASELENKLTTFTEPESNYNQGGFDVVIGNPPYFSLSTLEQTQTDYFRKRYDVFENTTDIYCLFFENAIKILRPNGLVSFITSNQWLQTNYGKILKKYFVDKTNPELLINFGGLKIFQDATVDTSILILSKSECKNNLTACHFKNDYVKGNSIDEYLYKNAVTLKNLNVEKWVIAKSDTIELKNKIRQKGEILKNWNIIINRGLLTGLNEAFILDTQTRNELIKHDKNASSIIKPILRGREVHKYSIEWAGLWLIVTKNGIDINDYPSIFNHLKSFGEKIKSRADQGDSWWNLRACSYYDLFEREKLIYPETTVRRSEFYYDNKKSYIDKTCFMITGENLKFLNGVLSSKLLEWYLESELRLLGKRSIQYSKQFIEKVPVPKISNNNFLLSDEIIKLVDQILKLNEEKQEAKLETSINQLKSKIDYCERRINEIVYELYELTPDEINIVEGK